MTTLYQFLLVAFGGAFGASLRFAVNLLFARTLGPNTTFPWATLVVNLVGCLMIGVLTAAVIERWPGHASTLRPLLIVGVLGGFTTFSSFALETSNLIEEKRLLAAASYVLASNVGCVALALLSLRLLRLGA
ncbi:MAG: fluoride efflux transporter CrcB [Tepidisphaeraceae bacterium]